MNDAPPTTEPVAVIEESLPRAGNGELPPMAVAERSRWGVLRHRHFRNVWMGAFGSAIGSWMEHVGVQWLMAEQTHSARMMGYLALAQLGPMLVLGLLGGLVADRVDRKKLLLVTQAIMMVIAATLAAACHFKMATPSMLIGLMLLNGIAMAFNVPAWQVLTPRLVPRDELAKAITLNGLQFNLARAIGPALGGLMMAQSSATVLFVINTISFLGVMLAVWSTPKPGPTTLTDGGRGLIAAAWHQTTEAFRFVFKSRGPFCVFIGLVLFSTLAGGTIMRMLPLFVSQVYDLQGDKGETAYGILLAMMGLGAVAGAVAVRYIPAWYPRHHFIPLSIVGGGASIALFSVIPTLAPACAVMLLVGVFWIWSFNSSIAAMQLLVTDAMRGRVMAVMNMVVFGAAPLGAIASAFIGEMFAGQTMNGEPSGRAVQFGVGVLASVLTCAGVVMLIWRTPEVDGIEPGEPGYSRKPGLWNGITASAHRPGRVIANGTMDEAPGQQLP